MFGAYAFAQPYFGQGPNVPYVAPAPPSPETLLLQGGYGFRRRVEAANGFRRTVQGADGSALSVEGGG